MKVFLFEQMEFNQSIFIYLFILVGKDKFWWWVSLVIKRDIWMTSLKFEDFKNCKMTTCTFCGRRLLAKSGVALGYIHEVTFFEIRLFGGVMNFGYPSLHNVTAHSLSNIPLIWNYFLNYNWRDVNQFWTYKSIPVQE